jgi:PUA domain protein
MLGLELKLHNLDIDSAEFDKKEILIFGHEIFGIIIDGTPFLTIKGLLKNRSERKYVTVDMGAVKFVSNGADIMAPGVVDADPEIEVGDLVWIRDEKNHQPLSIGRALMTGKDMVQNNSDKCVKTIHYVNDKLWSIEI